ncbi:MAG: acyltransferase domain-containing protein [Clostridiales bacterium]|nr:acyltransferase domain-containing protein [Clostridiales bacterium]
MNEKITVMFPGSGSQYKGMMKKLYDTENCVKEVFDQADEILKMNLGKTITEGSIIKLNKLENMLPGIFVSNVAMYHLFQQETGCKPDCFMGHSLGEYAALVAADIFSFEEALQAVWLRSCIAKEVQEKTDGGMTVCKGIEPCRVEEICKQLRDEEGFCVSIGCYNTKNQVSIVGKDEERQVAERAIRKIYQNAQIISLIGSAPYHSVLMKEKAEELKELLKSCHFAPIKNTVISNVTARPYETAEEIVKGLTKQLYQPVLWEKSLAYVSSLGVTKYLEIGPLNVLKNIFLDSGVVGKAFTYDELLDRDYLKGMFTKEEEPIAHSYQKVVAGCVSHARSLRNYRKVAFAGMELVKKQYQDTVEILKQSEQGLLAVEEEQVREALKMLVAMFQAKDTPMEERNERLIQIGEKSGETELCMEWMEME